MQKIGVYIYLNVPDSMTQDEVKAELKNCITFSSSVITIQFILPDPISNE